MDRTHTKEITRRPMRIEFFKTEAAAASSVG
jgi:hypothetical protein